jgi:hypothetical protein
MVDALYVPKNAAYQAPGDNAGFARVMAACRVANPRPKSPEDFRRCEVQAEPISLFKKWPGKVPDGTSATNRQSKLVIPTARSFRLRR